MHAHVSEQQVECNIKSPALKTWRNAAAGQQIEACMI
jgi:hypothetical protein